jgi:hypothetical protein
MASVLGKRKGEEEEEQEELGAGDVDFAQLLSFIPDTQIVQAGDAIQEEIRRLRSQT